MEVPMAIAMLMATVFGVLYGILVLINWSQRIRYPDDIRILKSFLREMRSNPECFETSSEVGLKTKGKGYAAASHGSLKYKGVSVNMGVLDEMRLNRAVVRHWLWQKRKDPKKAKLADEAHRA